MQKFDLDQISDNDILEGKMLLVDKPLQWTSFDVVKYIRKSLVSKFKIKKKIWNIYAKMSLFCYFI